MELSQLFALQLSQTAVKIATQYAYLYGAHLFLALHLTALRAVVFVLLALVHRVLAPHLKKPTAITVRAAKKKSRMMAHASMK